MTPKLDCSIMYAPAERLPDNSVIPSNEMHPFAWLGFTNPDGGVTLDRSIHSLSLTGKLTVVTTPEIGSSGSIQVAGV